jgi:hypothetical protein
LRKLTETAAGGPSDVHRAACLATLLALAASDTCAQEIRLKFAPTHLSALERQLRSYGFDCPRVKAVFFLGEKDDRNHMRVVCAGVQAADLSQIRMTVGGSGSYRAEPWIEQQAPGTLAASFALKSSFE